MKDNKIFQSRNLQEHKRGVHTDKNKLLAIKRRQKREDEGLAKTEFEIRKFKCQHCGKILKSADGLSRHIDNFHVAGKYSCARQLVKKRREKGEDVGKYSSARLLVKKRYTLRLSKGENTKMA